jgi:hypothetical protein
VRGQMLQLEETIKEDYGERMIRAFYTSVAKKDPDLNNYLCFTPTRIFYYEIKQFVPGLKWQMDWIDFDNITFQQGSEHKRSYILLVEDKKVRVDKKRYSYKRLVHEIKPVISSMIKMYLGEEYVIVKQVSPEVVREEIQIPVVYVNKGGQLVINNIHDSIVNRSFTSKE